MECIKQREWFKSTAIMMSCIIYLLFIPTKQIYAGIIPSSNRNNNFNKSSDVEKVKAFLERKIVQQRLVDYGVSPTLAVTKVHTMNNKDLHLLASMVDRIPDGNGEAQRDIMDLAIYGVAFIVIGIIWIIIQIIKNIKSSSYIDNTSEIIQNTN